ncbi:MAG TPA: hypothetical protein VIX12_04775 [Candidatus Binataceae bacterium]
MKFSTAVLTTCQTLSAYRFGAECESSVIALIANQLCLSLAISSCDRRFGAASVVFCPEQAMAEMDSPDRALTLSSGRSRQRKRMAARGFGALRERLLCD